MVIRGRVEHHDGVTNLVADRLEPLSTVYPQATGILPGAAPVPGLPLAGVAQKATKDPLG